MNYNVKKYVAQESTTIMQTKAFQRAIDECFLNGGGKVVVPKGTYLIGSIRLRSDITLYLESGAILLASRIAIYEKKKINNCEISQRFSLEKDSNRMDFEIQINSIETHKLANMFEYSNTL